MLYVGAAFFLFVASAAGDVHKTTDAVDICKAKDITINRVRQLNEKWNWNDTNNVPHQCTCERHFLVSRKQPPSVACRILGCRQKDGTFRPPGSKNANGCFCLRGTNPAKVDQFTLYHWTCDYCDSSADTLDIRRAVGQTWNVTNFIGIHRRCKCIKDGQDTYNPACTPFDPVYCLDKDKNQRAVGEEWVHYDHGKEYRDCSCVVNKHTNRAMKICKVPGCIVWGMSLAYVTKENFTRGVCKCVKDTEKMAATGRDDVYKWRCDYDKSESCLDENFNVRKLKTVWVDSTTKTKTRICRCRRRKGIPRKSCMSNET